MMIDHANESEKIIQKVSLDDHIILAVDEKNNSLLRFELTIANKPFLLKPPSYSQHMKLLVEHVRLCQLLCNLNNSIIYPSIEDLEKGNYFLDWTKKFAEFFQNKKVIKKIEKMLFKYFDVPFDKKYFRKHCTFFDFQKIFACIICLHEMIKKNSIFLLQKIHQISIQKSLSSDTSMRNTGLQKPSSITSPFSKSDSCFVVKPKGTLN